VSISFMKMNGELDATVANLLHMQPLRAGFAERTLVISSAIIRNLRRKRAMPLVKQTSKQERASKVATATLLGATGLGLSLLGNASATTMPAADAAQSDNTTPDQRFVLGEEEMADVSLATFHLFDREDAVRGVQLAARGCGCRGCAARGCRGCGVRACRGCGVRACAGCAVRACAVGCGVGCAVGSCCASWGYCRVC
jgi:hypothetical protein